MELDACERLPSEKYASPEIMLKIMLYAYHERKDVSSRTIEKNCKRDINYMYLLEGRKAPDHAAIARFRTKHFAKCARHFMAQMTKFLIELEQVTTSEVFIDGTKIESAANRYTFVWKKYEGNITVRCFRNIDKSTFRSSVHSCSTALCAGAKRIPRKIHHHTFKSS